MFRVNCQVPLPSPIYKKKLVYSLLLRLLYAWKHCLQTVLNAFQNTGKLSVCKHGNKIAQHTVWLRFKYPIILWLLVKQAYLGIVDSTLQKTLKTLIFHAYSCSVNYLSLKFEPVNITEIK